MKKTVIKTIVLASISSLAFFTASFAWFNFSVNQVATVEVGTGTTEITSYDFDYVIYNSTSQSYSFATQEYDKSTGVTYENFTDFDMSFYDPYYYLIEGEKEKANMITYLNFTVKSDSDFTTSINTSRFSVTGANSIFTSYANNASSSYLLSDIVYFQAVKTSDVVSSLAVVSDATTASTVFNTGSNYFFGLDSHATRADQSIFTRISASTDLTDQSLPLVSNISKSDGTYNSSDGTYSFSYLLNIDYQDKTNGYYLGQTAAIDDLLNTHEEELIINAPSFKRNFKMEIDTSSLWEKQLDML